MNWWSCGVCDLPRLPPNRVSVNKEMHVKLIVARYWYWNLCSYQTFCNRNHSLSMVRGLGPIKKKEWVIVDKWKKNIENYLVWLVAWYVCDFILLKLKVWLLYNNVMVIFCVWQENFVALCEMQRDLNGFDSLVQPDREFVRQGCLLKHSRKGYQQRMFFLVSRDV